MLFNLEYITTVWGDPIHITYDANKKSSVNDAIRYSGNYPTQSTASSTAALVGVRIMEAADANGWPISLPGFIHDCLEGSFANDFLLKAFDIVPNFAENWPFDNFGLPMSIDMEIGVRGGPFLVEFKRPKGELKFIKDGVLSAKFDGRADAVDLLFDRMRTTGYSVETSDVEEEEHYTSWSEMYMKVASAFRLSMGRKVLSKAGTVLIMRSA